MLKIRKTKWIARFLALTLAAGAAAVTTACGGEDKAVVQDEAEKKGGESSGEPEGRPEDPVKDKPDEVGDHPEGAEKLPESNEQDYGGLAARIEEGAAVYLEALKTGDIQTVLSMTDPDDKIYKKLSGIQDYETGKEFIRTLYGGLIYEWKEDRMTEYYIESVMNSELAGQSIYLDLHIGIPNTTGFYLYMTVPGVVFQDGELIPDGYKVSSDEEALQIVRSVAEVLPLEDTPVEVMLQEDGTFYFKMAGPFSCMNSNDFHSGENFLTDFLSDQIYGGVVVGTSEGFFKGYQEEWTEMLSLLKQKDFEGLIALANGNPDLYINQAFAKRTSYRTPEELTEAQRAFFDNYVEQIKVYVQEMTFVESQSHDFGVIIVTPAIQLHDDEEMEWCTENGIKQHTLSILCVGGDSKDDLISVMNDLLSPIEKGIEYAETKCN